MEELECSFLVEQSAHCLVQNHFERAFDLTTIIHNTVSDFNNTAIYETKEYFIDTIRTHKILCCMLWNTRFLKFDAHQPLLYWIYSRVSYQYVLNNKAAIDVPKPSLRALVGFQL